MWSLTHSLVLQAAPHRRRTKYRRAPQPIASPTPPPRTRPDRGARSPRRPSHAPALCESARISVCAAGQHDNDAKRGGLPVDPGSSVSHRSSKDGFYPARCNFAFGFKESNFFYTFVLLRVHRGQEGATKPLFGLPPLRPPSPPWFRCPLPLKVQVRDSTFLRAPWCCYSQLAPHGA